MVIFSDEPYRASVSYMYIVWLLITIVNRGAASSIVLPLISTLNKGVASRIVSLLKGL